MPFVSLSPRLNLALLTYWELIQLLIHDPIRLHWLRKLLFIILIQSREINLLVLDTPTQLLTPDRCETGHVPWAIPLSGERIPASDKFANIGNKQLKKIFKSSEFAGDYLSVLVADSLYRSARIYWGTSQTKKLSYYYTSEK